MSVLNRAWDPVDGLVTWKTLVPDVDGAEYPGTTAFSGTSDYCVMRDTRVAGPVEAQPLNREHSPSALWLLNRSLLDSSGAGLTMSVDTGEALYGPGPAPGTRALVLDGASIMARASHDASLLILGDVTLEALIYPFDRGAGFRDVMEFAGGPVDDEPNNSAWQMGLNGTSNNPWWAHEYGAGNNETHIWTDVTIPPHRWTHLTMVRDDTAKSLTPYVNGYQASAPINYTNSATGATTSRASIGGFWPANIQFFYGMVASAKVVPAALTAAQVLAEARLCVPPGYQS